MAGTNFMPVKEAEKFCGVGAKSIYKAINNGRIPEEYVKKMNGKTYVAEEGLDVLGKKKGESRPEPPKERIIEPPVNSFIAQSDIEMKDKEISLLKDMVKERDARIEELEEEVKKCKEMSDILYSKYMKKDEG